MRLYRVSIVIFSLRWMYRRLWQYSCCSTPVQPPNICLRGSVATCRKAVVDHVSRKSVQPSPRDSPTTMSAVVAVIASGNLGEGKTDTPTEPA